MSAAGKQGIAALGDFARSVRAMGLLYVGAAGASFAVGVTLARLLGPAQYGIYALAMTSATLAGVITEAGLPNLAMRETGRARAGGDWALLKGLLRWSDALICSFSLVIVALVWSFSGGAALGGSTYLAAMLWGVLLIPVVGLGKMRAQVLLALDAPYASQVPQMIVRPVLFVGGCLALYRTIGRIDAAGAMAVQVACAAVASLSNFVLMRRHRPPELSLTLSRSAPRDWLESCVPMGASEGLRMLQGQLGLLLVGWLAGPAAAGLYRVADAVMQVASLAASSVATAATPMFARLWSSGDRAGLQRVALMGAWAMLGGTFVLGLPVLLLGSRLFPWLFGHDFAPALPAFALLWCGAMITASCGLAIAIANMTGYHLLTTRSLVLVAASNAVLGWLLIPRFGPAGGALATALSSGLGAASCAWSLRRRTGVNATILGGRPRPSAA